MIIALYGPSRVGKSTIARALARVLSVPVRHCGDELRKRAILLGHPMAAVPRPVHQAIDEETRAFLRAVQGTVIAEGRFLDFVLHRFAGVRPVKLVCRTPIRDARLSQAGLPPAALSDASDARLRQILYFPSVPSVPDCLTIDTSSITPHQAVQRLLFRIRIA